MTQCPHCNHANEDGASFCESCGKPLVADASGAAGLESIGGLETQAPSRKQAGADFALEPGSLFADRYTILSLIGQGGMGIVYRAKDSIGDRDVALKLIRSDRLSGDSAIKKLISEGITTQDISHRNVVKVYHVGQVDNHPFFAMEFVEGTSLRAWQRRQVNTRHEISMATAARIIVTILDGLEAAHDLGIIHRDLSPENIILTAEPDGENAPLKILDFGIARTPGQQMESGTGTGLGKPRYMAPEQITNPDGAGPSADLYSLSIIFYELLVDVLPQGHWQPPSGGRADVPAAIDALIQQGLSNRPASRPQTAREYRDRLLPYLGGQSQPDTPEIEPDKPEPHNDNPDKKPGMPKWLKVGGGITAALIGLAVIGNLIGEPDPNQCAGLAGDALDHCLGKGPVYLSTSGGSTGGGKAVDPPPQPPVSAMAKLSGEWADGFGGYVSVDVADNGEFRGEGKTSQNVPVGIGGSIRGGTYTLQMGGYSFPGKIAWDGACHLNFTTFNPNGSANLSGQFHVNHEPGAPCP